MWSITQPIEELAREFRASGRVVIERALPKDAAYSLYEAIQDITERQLWYQAIHGDGRFVDRSDSNNPSHFTYRMDKFPVANVRLDDFLGVDRGDSRRRHFDGVRKFAENPELELPDGHPVRGFGRLINTIETASLVSKIVDKSLPAGGANCFLSRYMSGDYLAAHDDGLTGNSGRRVAFVYSITPMWLPHWGGHTVFLDQAQQSRAETIIPNFNSLLLFAVPVPHVVTAIANICPFPRFAFTGWFHAKAF